MKQWQSDRENPDNIRNRNEIMKKRSNSANKNSLNKKMSVAALCKWHDVDIMQVCKKVNNGL